MRAIPIPTPHFSFNGRGPTLRRFILDEDLLLPGSNAGFAELSGKPCGAVYDTYAKGPQGTHFVIFHGLQVFQSVPHEVHSYWHCEGYSGGPHVGVFQIEASEWLASFDRRHLAHHSHFVLEWYDDIVEVICRELIFGEGDFELSRVLPTEPRLAYAYFRHAMSQETLGDVDAAIESWSRYLAFGPHVESVEFAAARQAALRDRS